MALFGVFIGIDRFQDSTIRELSGCRRDAQALWALFTDTMPEMRAALLLDDDATSSRIQNAFDETLGAATEDDVVILSFSSHGTADHRLVAHDTDRTRYADTTIDMGELARRFKQSRARAVVCVLDCCFSGGAPARVLDDTPATRSDGLPLDTVAGVGRILISASNVNEPALELDRHGLLTRALFEALQAGNEAVSVTAVMDAIMERVRTEAARKGYVQTPVLFGHVEGGLVLPALRKGPNYFKLFPEAKGVRVSSRIPDLAAFGIPEPVLGVWATLFPGGLNPLQLGAVNESRVLDGRSLLVVAPTSSGKTLVGELAAAKAIAERRKAVFLFPYKALVNEKFEQFRAVYGDKLGMRVTRCTGDYLDQTSAFIKGTYDLAVLTYEMFLNLTVANPGTLDLLGLVVVDEIQFISDEKRGIVIELLLTNLLAARERGVAPQLVALSAVIGDLNGFDQWLGGEKLVRFDRPVPLTEGVIDRSGAYQYRDPSGKERVEQLIPRHNVVQRKQKPEKQDVIVPLVRAILTRRDSERVIIFRNKKGSAQGAAKYLADELSLAPAQEALAALPTVDPSTSLPVLRDCLAHGTAFHTSDLSRDERVVVEQAFRDRGGHVRVLVATTTVAAGVNTPASTVILPEQEFLGEEGRPFSVAEYKNMAGRAGRVGYNEEGRSILIADTPTEREQLFRQYVTAAPGPIVSSFNPADTETWLLRLLAQVPKVSRAEVPKLLAATFGGYTAGRQNPSWHSKTVTHLARLLDEMTRLGLVEEEAGFVHLTVLGRACGNSSLAFRSSLRLVEMLRSHGPGMRAEELPAMLQALPELDAMYTPMRRGQENQWTREVLVHFGRPVAQALQRHPADDTSFPARCKRAMIIRSWLSGVPMEHIERESSRDRYFNAIGAGHVRGFADATRFHLRSAAKIAMALLIENGPDEQEIEDILRRMEVGVPADVLDLLSLPVPLSRGECLHLRQHGFRSRTELWACSDVRFIELLGKVRAQQLARYRPTSRPDESDPTSSASPAPANA